jgi:hypothetical protein
MAKKMGNLETSLAIWIKNCYPSSMLEEGLRKESTSNGKPNPAPDSTCLQLNMFEAFDIVITAIVTALIV